MPERTSEPLPDGPLPPGTILHGRYQIESTLGSSRASVTYLAWVRKTDDPCVVKELSVAQVVRGASGADSYDPADFTKLVDLFEREARTLTHLDHPGIPRLIDHFAVETGRDTRLYIVQEKVPGKSLAALVEEGKHFTEAEAIALCRQVAEVLDYIHGVSPPLIHRDVKPSNVMVDGEGEVHLIDFGSVRSAVAGADVDGMTVVGTFGYMPIEQYESRALPASDLYALGGTMVFALSHRAPHQLPRKGIHLDFRPYVNVSDAFADVLEKMLEPSPDDRYQSASEVLRDLARVERGRGRPARRWGRRHVGAAAMIALLGVGGASALLRPAGEVPAGARAQVEAEEPPPIDPGPGRPSPVVARNGQLVVDLYRDFAYEPAGFPMNRSVGQTALNLLTRVPHELLREPVHLRDPGVDVHYGSLFMGNGEDTEIALVLFRQDGVWRLHADENNDEDLSNDGPPMTNRGDGPLLAASFAVEVEVATEDGSVKRPYDLWMWFTPTDDNSRIRGAFYALNHYRGTLQVGGSTYDAVAFERTGHDGLYRDAGLCIDVDRDAKCNEDHEVFFDGDAVPLPEGTPRLVLEYP